MTKIKLFQFIFLSLVVISAYGQKLSTKYLRFANTKRYEEAEPFLKGT